MRDRTNTTSTATEPAPRLDTPTLVEASPVAASAPGLILQAKLQVGAANDPLETEADRAAADFLSWSGGGLVARSAELDGASNTQVSRAAQGTTDMMGSFAVDENVEHRIESARGGGKPLPDRAQYESFFGADLSAVRVHDGGESAELNRSIAARAFTTGTDVFLGSGATTGDRELMAHELTHVVQQSGAVSRRVDFQDVEGEEATGIVGKFQKQLTRALKKKDARKPDLFNAAVAPVYGEYADRLSRSKLRMLDEVIKKVLLSLLASRSTVDLDSVKVRDGKASWKKIKGAENEGAEETLDESAPVEAATDDDL